MLPVSERSSLTGSMQERREGDSNPRSGFPDTTFPVLHNRPLCHLSGNGLKETRIYNFAVQASTSAVSTPLALSAFR